MPTLTMLDLVCAAADRRGFARLLGKAIRRPSSTSDIPVPEEDEKPANSQFPPSYNDPSVPPAFARASKSGAVAHPIEPPVSTEHPPTLTPLTASTDVLEDGKLYGTIGVQEPSRAESKS